ncbi:hypothetical protein WJX84_005794, partial [Apatococcus fuscideae]
ANAVWEGGIIHAPVAHADEGNRDSGRGLFGGLFGGAEKKADDISTRPSTLVRYLSEGAPSIGDRTKEGFQDGADT